MIIATVTALYLIFGGGGASIDTLFTDLGKPVKQAIEDKEHRDEILTLSEGLEEELKNNQEAWEAEVDDLLKIMDDYASNPLDFEAKALHLEELLSQRHALVLETRGLMKGLMSEAEWNAVFADR